MHSSIVPEHSLRPVSNASWPWSPGTEFTQPSFVLDDMYMSVRPTGEFSSGGEERPPKNANRDGVVAKPWLGGIMNPTWYGLMLNSVFSSAMCWPGKRSTEPEEDIETSS